MEINMKTDRYKIVRHYLHGETRPTIKRDLSLKEAQAHCNDPDTSSRTCHSAKSRAVTKIHGEWFDGYEQE